VAVRVAGGRSVGAARRRGVRVANAPASSRRSALRRATRGAPSKARNAPRATRQSVCRLTAVREHTTHHADAQAENRIRPLVRRARPSTVGLPVRPHG